ncbi:MAG TPA: DUF418 domain-containing protein [Chitinophagaceae bacterium]|nr:DUF418 domain-containing protein [Chitinophagaceae bacterium]
MTTSIAPVEQKERAVIVDTLRGFALVGVLIANFTSYTDQQVPADILKSISSPFDTALMHINTVFFEWKFMTLFSILFGYGFGLILTSLQKKNINPNSFFLRRMFWLFILGFIHTSFWWFDVLHLYAISGIFLLLFRKASNKTILICSVVFMFIIPFCFSFAMRNQPKTFSDADWRNVYEQFKNGNLVDVFKANLTGYYKLFILSVSDVHDIIETLGRFLFGYFLLRIKLFESIETKKNLFRKIIFITAPVVIAYFIIRWLAVKGTINIDVFYWKPFIKIGIISTTCIYASLIVLLFISFTQNKIFKALQALGKMTLTNYLLVSAVLIIILYGIGFGKLGELPMHIIWLYAFIWLVFEIIFSIYWLRIFRYGPIELIWRQLTYGKKIPLRK